jgi:hypothetical protein
MENETAFISLSKSLDSFREVVLSDYAMIEDSEEKAKYSDFVTEKVKLFLIDNAEDRRESWKKAGGSPELLAGRPALCPPGFVEVDGLCIPV